MRIRRGLAGLGWRLSPYRLVGHEPGVFLGAPHTGTWDFIALLGVAWHYGKPMKVLIKDSWVRGPAGPLIRAMGGIGVDRSRPGGLVDELVARAGATASSSSSRRRAPVRHARTGRSGFRRIALAAGPPVTPAGIDSARGEVEIGPTLTMTDDVRADMDAIRASCARFGASSRLGAPGPACARRTPGAGPRPGRTAEPGVRGGESAARRARPVGTLQMTFLRSF
ncbi:acyl-phosphate glycerol 3-phosphate acyltransferase [Propionibacterium acidifaciens]